MKSKFRTSKSVKNEIFDLLNSPKFDITWNLSGRQITTFPHSAALTSHSESFWSILVHFFWFSGFKKLQSGSESPSKMVVLGHPFQKDIFHQPSVSILRGKLLFFHFEQLNLLSIHLFFGLICKQANQYYRFGHFAAVVHKTTMMSIEQPRG